MSYGTASTGTAAAQKASHTRYLIVFMLFMSTAINYADRSTLPFAGPALTKELGLDPVAFGWALSSFGWTYVLAQLPSGWLLDRFGTKRVYTASLVLWSVFTFLQGFVFGFGIVPAIAVIFALRMMVGLAEAPSFPGNARIVAAWFPTAERGTASAIFNSAQYFQTVLFAGLMGWLVQDVGWRWVFFVMGGIGLGFALIWLKLVHGPKRHPWANAAELAEIEAGGALVTIEQPAPRSTEPAGVQFRRVLADLGQLLRNRMLLGVYIGQYCITTLTYFFITWFPSYLVQARGLSILKAGFVAALPAICGFIGGVLGGLFSDFLLRRGFSLTVARKTPIVLGMLLSMVMIACNYLDTDWLIVATMSLAYFGKGVGALGWAVVSDTAPKQISGLSGSLFNMFGNTAAITTPIVIGYIVKNTGSFDGALIFVGANALIAVFCYLVIVGEIKRVELVRSPA